MDKLQELKDKYDITSEYKEDKEVSLIHEEDEGITLIQGTSGSGKTTLLKTLSGGNAPEFPEGVSIIEAFSSVSRGEELLLAFGLRSVPTWFRSIEKVSNGEKHRAECAYLIDKGYPYIDEFTSVVDRNTAKSLSVALRKCVDKGLIKNITVASCHHDLVEWLQPNRVYNTDSRTEVKREVLRHPEINLEIKASSIQDWVRFKNHHYLDTNISKSCHFYTAYIEEQPVAFLAIMHRCNRDIKSYWGESRLVVLPEFQGLGIGYALSEAVADEYKERGLRYFSKTAHPALGEKRNSSESWRATSTNMQKRRSYLKKNGEARKQKGFGKTEKTILRDAKRICYSHEYIKGE
ncbi:MAG: GNAT family N-acetyltransferase [Colwellia sp.]|nr:GNAT family N-acetyltransferase [Colwellia sp.]